MYTIYQLFLTIAFYTALPFMLLYLLITGKHREGLRQRLGLYRRLPVNLRGPRIWLHAASVGEVQAAAVLIAELRRLEPTADFVLTTMTIHGRKLAEEQLGGDATCLLAPLDVPGIVDLVIHAVSPDIYVCIETELWPVLLRRLKTRSTPVVLVNGRMSERSAARYSRHAWLFGMVVANFDALCMISETDKARYLSLGAARQEITVTGNLKYDRAVPADEERIRGRYRQLLAVDPDTEILITGSTHSGEEEILLPVFRALYDDRPLLWVVAPRHLTRLPHIEELLRQNGIGFDRFSSLMSGGERQQAVILLDSFGELAELYSIGTYIFCGGSFVECNGHNVLEPAHWGRTVFYGPSMGDFQDAVDLLKAADGGVPVAGGRELLEKISFFRENPELYRQMCERAGRVARAQQGAAGRQAQVIVARLSAAAHPGNG